MIIAVGGRIRKLIMLMLTFGDAVKVVEKIVEAYIDHSIEEGDTEYIKQELEQKCYIPEKGSAAERLSGLIMDINPAEIASMIQSDKLREWCKTIQVEMNMSLIKMDWGEMGKELIRCKDCKHFELNHIGKVNGISLIVAHKICKRWGDGCRTSENGWCFLAERKEECTQNVRCPSAVPK